MKLTVNRNTVPVRRAAADGRLGRAHRHAGGDDARLRRGRLPRGRRDHRRRARRGRRTSTALALAREALCAKRPLYPGFRGYTDYVTRDVAQRQARRTSTHPLVQHKLGLPARQATRRPCDFRKLVDELTLLLTYEATKDLPTEDGRDRDAARARRRSQRISGQEGRGLPDPARGRRDARRRASRSSRARASASSASTATRRRSSRSSTT